jgi:hypothetical protein
MSNSALTPSTFGQNIVVPGVSPGQVSASGLPGSTTGTPIASGFVGQKISGTMSDVTFSASDTAINAGSIVLNKGIYLAFARTRTVPGGTTHTQNNMGISTASASLQHPYYVSDQSTNIVFSRYQQFVRYLEITSDSTSIYVVVVATYTGAAASVAATQGDFYAIRIA